MTAKLANDRLNDDRHPVTGAKFKPRPGLSITTQREGYRWAIRGKQYGPREIAEADIDKHLEGIDEVFQQEYPETRTADAISEDNIVDGTRNRSEPQRLPQPAIGVEQDGEGMSYHARLSWRAPEAAGHGSSAGGGVLPQQVHAEHVRSTFFLFGGPGRPPNLPAAAPVWAASGRIVACGASERLPPAREILIAPRRLEPQRRWSSWATSAPCQPVAEEALLPRWRGGAARDVAVIAASAWTGVIAGAAWTSCAARGHAAHLPESRCGR
jgi:hypothetical protein